jgi:hypothetical protein
MRKVCWVWALVLGTCGVSPGKEEPAAPRWLSDYEQARKAARESGRPIFVVFRCEH